MYTYLADREQKPYRIRGSHSRIYKDQLKICEKLRASTRNIDTKNKMRYDKTVMTQNR